MQIGTTQTGKKFGLPIDALTRTFSVLGIKRSGKSYTAKVLAEEFLNAGQLCVAFDPTGAWWGLRSKFPVLVIGGDHADLPLDPHAGEYLAKAVVERRFPVIFDFSATRKGAMRQFVLAFTETLFHLNREPMHLFIDEADMFCPQMQRFGGDSTPQLIGAIEDIVKRGRKKGIGCTLITQRPASLNKDVLTQTEMLVCHRVAHNLEVKAVKDWIAVQADLDQGGAMIASLPTLPTGTGWFWGPGMGEIFEKVSVRQCETFDSSATPKVGEKVRKPKELAKVDVEALGAEIAAMKQKAVDDDPKHLKAELARLRKELAAKPVEVAKPERFEIPIVLADDIRALRELQEKCENLSLRVAQVVDRAGRVNDSAKTFVEVMERTAVKKPARIIPKKIPSGPGEKLSKIERAFLTVLAQHGECSKSKMAILAGYSPNSSTTSNGISSLRSAGRIAGTGDAISITSDGLTALGDYSPLPSGDALRDYWVMKMPQCPGEILAVLLDNPNGGLTKESLAAQTASNYSPTSSTFNNGLSYLRTMGLLKRGELKAESELFN